MYKYWDSNAVYFKIKLDGQANGEIWAFQLHPLEWLWDMLYHGCCSHHLDGDVQCNQAIPDSLWNAIQIIVSVRIIHGLGKLSDFVLFVTCFLVMLCDLLYIHVLKHQTSVIRVLNKGLVCRHFSSMESRHSKCWGSCYTFHLLQLWILTLSRYKSAVKW